MAFLPQRARCCASRVSAHRLKHGHVATNPSTVATSHSSPTESLRYASSSPGFVWASARYRYAAPTASLPTPPAGQSGTSGYDVRLKVPNKTPHRSTHTFRPVRGFHTYFVTHLPSSSLHPESGRPPGPGHGLPRDASTPHTPSPGSSPAVAPPNMTHRDLTVVRIPLRRAKHHFGSFTSRGSRPYNEDTDQAGTIDIPAFARRAPQNVIRRAPGEAKPADSALGDPQIFYFGLFDGHGGSECSNFLRDELHGYIEEASTEFGLHSTLEKTEPSPQNPQSPEKLDAVDPKASKSKPEEAKGSDAWDYEKALNLQRKLVAEYKERIGGYFRRFDPQYFDLSGEDGEASEASIEQVLMYAFLRADLDFVAAQAQKPDPDDSRVSDTPLNDDEILGVPHAPPSGHGIGGNTRFKGGSTASVALISTPTPAPFWHPSAYSTLLVAHVGDTRILLCDTLTGEAHPLTSDHHPGTPAEERRLRRYAPAGSMVSGDSFGEQRIAGLANSRAFGDIRSKRIGVSAEPEMTRLDIEPGQYSFMVLMSDGVSGTLSDQEIVDVIKEAKTPEQGARAVVEYATEVSHDGDNATCQVVRLGGWERRSEGGVGSLGTKEIRDVRRAEALDPRRGKR